MRQVILAVTLALAGCSSDQEKKALDTFMKSCNGPVAAKLTLTQWGNAIEFNCADLKADAK